MQVEHLTKQSFLEKIFDYEKKQEWSYQGDKPAIIDFYADWCGPCKMVGPIMEELKGDYDGKVDIYKINTEEEQELAAIFGIRSIPSVLFIPVEDKPRMSVGAMPKEGYQKAINDVLGVPNPEQSN
jgi:thioredoxin 1